jgi:basic amino acid/polyamine antiporter, APA family
MSAELRDPRRDLTRGLLIGVLGVVAIYLSMNFVYLRVLGAGGLAATSTPASTAMQQAVGSAGATFTAVAIAVSTLGFLSQGMLTAPRVYFAMAEDGLFFRSVSYVSSRALRWFRSPCRAFWPARSHFPGATSRFSAT